MQTIRALVNKIRWSEGGKDYVLGYVEHVSGRIERFSFSNIDFEESSGFFLKVGDKSIPFHRIRRVWKGKELIWSRD